MLAYSGGLDTSVILKWLKEEYDCEVITFTADLGQARPLMCSLHPSPLLRAEVDPRIDAVAYIALSCDLPCNGTSSVSSPPHPRFPSPV